MDVPNDKPVDSFSLDHGSQGNDLFGVFPNHGADIAAKTDDQGKFEIANLPDSQRVILSVKAFEAKEKVICVRGEDDSRGEDLPLQVLVENDFSIGWKPPQCCDFKPSMRMTIQSESTM